MEMHSVADLATLQTPLVTFFPFKRERERERERGVCMRRALGQQDHARTAIRAILRNIYTYISVF